MARWAVFAGVTAFVLVLLLVLARVSQLAMSGAGDDSRSRHTDSGSSTTDYSPQSLESGTAAQTPHTAEATVDDPASLSTGRLLANVALSQGLFLVLLVGGAWYARIPLAALGVTAVSDAVLSVLAVGIVIGICLSIFNELGSLGAEAVGIETPDEFRESLAPDSSVGWLVLLCVILPTIAIFEEFLFRAALIGALSAGFSLSPWLLALFSSVAFALGHGAQGTVGMVATGVLGFALASAFIVTGSLLVVVVAHYLVNALEFVVHEGFGVELTG